MKDRGLVQSVLGEDKIGIIILEILIGGETVFSIVCADLKPINADQGTGFAVIICKQTWVTRPRFVCWEYWIYRAFSVEDATRVDEHNCYRVRSRL